MHWWRRLLILAVLGWGGLLAVRCHLPRQATAPDADRDSTSAVYLVQHGWHAGIAVRQPAVSSNQGPRLEGLPEARYVEVGWGEARYYPGHTRGVWGAVRAGAWPTGSVLHVIPVPDAVPTTFPQKTIVRIPVGADELERLRSYVADSFAGDTSATPVADGFYPGSRFYRSSLSYHAFNNCNHWAAGALEAAGCDTTPRWTFTVGQVVRQARECGTLVQGRTSK